MYPMQNNQPDPKLYYSLFDLTPWESIPTHTASFCHHKWAKLCDSFCCVSLFPPALTLCLPPPGMLGIDSSYGSEDNTGVWGMYLLLTYLPRAKSSQSPLARKEQPHKTGKQACFYFQGMIGGIWAFEVLNLPNSLFLFSWSHSFLYMPECPPKRREVYGSTLRCSSEPWRIRPWVRCFDLVSSTATRQKTVLAGSHGRSLILWP